MNDCEDILDDNQHYITFQLNQPVWKQHSDAKERKSSFTGRDLKALYESTRPQWKNINKEYACDLFKRSAAVVRLALDREEPHRSVRSPVPLLDFDPYAVSANKAILNFRECCQLSLA